MSLAPLVNTTRARGLQLSPNCHTQIHILGKLASITNRAAEVKQRLKYTMKLWPVGFPLEMYFFVYKYILHLMNKLDRFSTKAERLEQKC